MNKTLLEYLKELPLDVKIDITFFWSYAFDDSKIEFDDEISYYGLLDDFFNFPLSCSGVSFAQDYGERYYDTYDYKIIDTNEPIEIEVYARQWG